MIDVKQAVKAAKDYATEILGDLPNLELEEVEISDDDRYWLITFGFDTNKPTPENPAGLAALGYGPKARKYKIIEIAKDDGKFKAMKIREPANTTSSR
jgi:hypothetical protein